MSPNDTHRVRLDNVDDIGAALKRARIQRGISIEEVARVTKITPATLRAIERNDIEHVPRGIFLRGFLRAYARYLDLDVDDTTARYLAQFEEPPEPAAPPEIEEWDDQRVRDGRVELDGDGREALGRRIFVAVAVGLCVLGYFMLRAPEPRSGPLLPAAAIPWEPAAAPVAEASTGTSGIVEASQSQPGDLGPQNSVRLDVLATGPCWVEATVDGAPVFMELLQAGDERSFDVRQELVLRVGDPATFSYRIDGVPGRPLGRPAVPVTVRMTPENYRAFIADVI